MVGATTTLLIEKIRQLRLPPLEATVLPWESTRIPVPYFSSTTSRDAEAVSFVLARGANLAVVTNFWCAFQKSRDYCLNAAGISQYHDVNGIKFLLAKGRVDEFVAGLDLLTHKLVDFAIDAVFTVVEMEDNVYVARAVYPGQC